MVADTECGSACYCCHYVGDTEGTSLYHQAPCVPDQQLPCPLFPSLEHSVPSSYPTSLPNNLMPGILSFLWSWSETRSADQPWSPGGLILLGVFLQGWLRQWGLVGRWDACRGEGKRPVFWVMRMLMGVGSQLKSTKDCDSYYRPGNGIPTLGPGWPSVCLLSCGGRSVLCRDWPA